MRILFAIFAFVISTAIFAQSDPLQPRALQFPSTPYPNHFNTPSINTFSLITSGTHSLAPIDPAVHYPAFFCRMELKTMNHLGIWIKVHAGDYDTYSRPNAK